MESKPSDMKYLRLLISLPVSDRELRLVGLEIVVREYTGGGFYKCCEVMTLKKRQK